jgi:hypothetical protein
MIRTVPPAEEAKHWYHCVTQLEDRRERLAVVSPNGVLLRLCDGVSKTPFVLQPVVELQLGLVTGRTHQIRASLAAEQCPVWGDFWYGFPNSYGFDPLNDPPVALRAVELSFPDQKGNMQTFRIP